MPTSISYGPWRVENICLTNQRFLPLFSHSHSPTSNSFHNNLPTMLPSHLTFSSQFVGELARVAAPGGTIIIVTWCHRDLHPSEQSLQPWEQNLLNRICDSYYLPAWCSTADYVTLLESLSLQVLSCKVCKSVIY